MALALAVASFPMAVNACEPIIPLTQLIGGSGLAGPLLLTQSVAWLLIAVTIKSVAFVFLERRLPWPKAICFMLVGNVLSTIPGLFAALFAGSVTLLALPIIFGFGVLAQRRLNLLSEQAPTLRFSGKGVPFAFTGAFIISVVMFYLAGSALDAGQFTKYWILKLLFATVAVTMGMAISTVLEEYAVGHLARKTYGQMSFFTAVMRANYLTLGWSCS
jgi:ABC-type multidrug transport system fused ATPase/permease subunit